MSPLDPESQSSPQVLECPDGRSIAYHKTRGTSPGIVFLGGFMSDMTGSKALAFETWARDRNRSFLRFDYQGHGSSSGRFDEGSIGLWASDAIAALDALTAGPQILIGSSMGGWIMLLAALARPGRVAGLMGIAAAPDFTEDLMWARYPQAIREALTRDGRYEEPSEYSEEPYVITLKLIEEGRDHLLLRRPIPLDCPVRLVHGIADPDVPWQVSVTLAEKLRSEDVEVTLIKKGGHRLSEPDELLRLTETLDKLIAAVEAGSGEAGSGEAGSGDQS